MGSSLVIDVWGKQASESNSADGKNTSTKQLMNEENIARGRTRQGTELRGDDEERYKMLCEINTFKRRAERNAKKLVRVLLDLCKCSAVL